MRIVKPTWLIHPGEKKEHEIYSCHVSPDGKRLVTGAGDGYVRIWSTEAIYNITSPNNDKPKQLASMSYHSGTIHSVRFSPGGKFLASGADDRIVCIYNHDPSPPPQATFGNRRGNVPQSIADFVQAQANHHPWRTGDYSEDSLVTRTTFRT